CREELRLETVGLAGDVGEVAGAGGLADRARLVRERLEPGRRLLEDHHARVGVRAGGRALLEDGVRIRGAPCERVAALEQLAEELAPRTEPLGEALNVGDRRLLPATARVDRLHEATEVLSEELLGLAERLEDAGAPPEALLRRRGLAMQVLGELGVSLE